MGKKKKAMKGLMALMPAVAWSMDKAEMKRQWKDYKSNLETYWEQAMETQKTSKEAWKEQWNKIFPKLLEMQDNFADTLPDELPTPPGMAAGAIKPKYFMDKLKEFQEMANKHATDLADAAFDFRMQSQEQAKGLVVDAVDNIADNLPDDDDDAEESDKD